jgi:peptide/nickel transport system permease protein
MARYLLYRLLAAVLTLWLASMVVFMLVRSIPGDIVQIMMGQTGSSGSEASLRQFFGLDQPVWIQYLHWLGRIAVGDLGRSWQQGAPVLAQVLSAFSVSFELSLLVLLLSTLIGIPLGLVAGHAAGGWVDTLVQGFNVLFLAIPVFWLALMLLFGVSTYFYWSPPTIYTPFRQSAADNLTMMMLPVLSLAFLQISAYAQFVRQHVAEAMRQDYVRALRARGMSAGRILVGHVLRNILVPLTTFVGLIFIQILGGVVVIESIFGLPGLGRLLVDAIYARDFPIVQGALLVILVCAILINFVIDVLYRVIDPRLRA